MKNRLRSLAFVLMVGCAYAQSNLPACQGSNSARWSNCLGTFTFPGGDKNVSEYQNGARFGQGEKVMKITGGKQQPWEYGSLIGGELVLSAIKPR
jgi:hypothetical protein